ncbi:uncharacterized protein LOC126743231 [Anthonomus grandis grandis]|uniref:uncharacterized protein LOC126743231 n=1 Tax=Anthonomus grandis grandis TaxID=2921223 RepID=UPI002164FD26|nr:uncharacterized protein LOC126743231 [Anthonomus grandis grandis]XP_050306182.1 uncharacterized protein LOC126743231 [Anthonomus grandis grandis]XP_050306183.1 uncharacterized protein LOC126743231 [Anthonomus grandis grandis]
MKLLTAALLSLATLTVVQTQEASLSQDYLTRILLNISEARIPNYLINVIYDRPVEKSISAQAVLTLYQANTTNLTFAEHVLQSWNVSNSQVFSINGFYYTMNLFNWTFTNFYNTAINRLGLSGAPLRNGLVALNINVNEFSAGIAYGEPDPWQEFIKGNFSRENLEVACSAAGITLEALWEVVRDLFINDLITFQVEDFVRLLLNHNIQKQHALIMWNSIPITLEHVYSIPLYSEIISNFSSRVSQQNALGVLISNRDVVVHRTLQEFFEAERELLDIHAETVITRTSLLIGEVNTTIYNNLVVLRHNVDTPFTNLTAITVASENSNLTNCSYVTFQNNNVMTVNVPLAIYDNDSYILPRSVVQNVIPGSALVCNVTVYGLARGAENGHIVVDPFSDFVSPPSSGHMITFGVLQLGILLSLGYIL